VEQALIVFGAFAVAAVVVFALWAALAGALRRRALRRRLDRIRRGGGL
jgi:threonine/homoserine/homoserine lactone efflux protein